MSSMIIIILAIISNPALKNQENTIKRPIGKLTKILLS